jgi:hypothetical protein
VLQPVAVFWVGLIPSEILTGQAVFSSEKADLGAATDFRLD